MNEDEILEFNYKNPNKPDPNFLWDGWDDEATELTGDVNVNRLSYFGFDSNPIVFKKAGSNPIGKEIPLRKKIRKKTNERR